MAGSRLRSLRCSMFKSSPGGARRGCHRPLGARRIVCAAVLTAALAGTAFCAQRVPDERVDRYVATFNAMAPETVTNAVPDAAAAAWLKQHVPRFTCPDPAVEEIYWFRWWAMRKHLRCDPASGRWVFTEFITRQRPVSSALGHHLMEGRWLTDPQYHDDYVLYWLRGDNGMLRPDLHKYSQWFAHALWSRWLVTQDTGALTDLLDDLVRDDRQWEEERMRPDGLFWQYDVRDAMEESISGGRTVRNVRPTISCYMFGNAAAIARMAERAGRPELAREFQARAARLRQLVQENLWDDDLEFFGSVTEDLERIKVREAIGFIPWYFGLPEKDRGFEVAWGQILDDDGFRAPYGLTTAERRHPAFRSHGTGTCEWDGAVWPFATSQTLTALSRVLHEYEQNAVTKQDWYDAFLTYTRSHRFDGRPYIGEYLDETTGAWLKGRNPRSVCYNHSTYADLVITGLVGLQPSADATVRVDPLLPDDTWPWFCLEGVPYHGHRLTIVWDRDGSRFGCGPGLTVLAGGETIARAPRLDAVTGDLP